MSDVALTEDEGHVRIVQLNRPAKKNALNLSLAAPSTSASESTAKPSPPDLRSRCV
jgi:enoyl-CoA hydratase/carnithine racemase